ncbi:hypothetical protein SAY87_016313 [Trapa incisa]|uniref:Uncharacterized protein n=1 Tax=Trapa incisa TaxID=236973 RepID=A0AAN7L5W0_9MYRT|nr:hypothetical protein SAY87_016313 [Trapa incisa]
MFSNKGQEYGFRGYQAPSVPRAPRSTRRTCPILRKTSDGKLRPFDILASVAGELLLKKDACSISHSSSTHRDQYPILEAVYDEKLPDKCKTLELKPSIPENCGKSLVVSESLSPKKDQDGGFEFNAKDASVSSAIGLSLDVDNRSISNLVDERKKLSKDVLMHDGKFGCSSYTDMCRLGNQIKYFSNKRKVDGSDDGENWSGCTPLSSMKKKMKPFNSVPRTGDRRIRKILASKFWKNSKLKSTRSDGNLKIGHWDRIGCYRDQRYRRNFAYNFSAINHIKNFYIRGRSSGPKKGGNKDVSEYGSSPLKVGHHTSNGRKYSHVKLQIESFRIPELFIEVAETSTIGSLKKTVMEALSAILKDGAHVGVLLRGEIVKDDRKTLLHSGIYHDNPPDALSFILEPKSSLAPQESPKLPNNALTRDASHTSTGCAANLDAHREASLPLTESHGAKAGKLIENDHHDAASSVVDEHLMESRDLAATPALRNRETLPAVPVQQRVKDSVISQRRVRRPFSVAEVEALVQAVEKLGTGRWRDVKFQAFGDVEHRTYVDLKDKWKTLVHTARISPQQRRGEPIPQELLDRVLAAHAYWSHKQQM